MALATINDIIDALRSTDKGYAETLVDSTMVLGDQVLIFDSNENLRLAAISDVVGDPAHTFGAAITFEGAITSDVLQSATHGAGATSTSVTPTTYIRTENGGIITTLKIDLTGLKSKNDVDDVIGIDGTAKASFIRVITASHGFVYRGEMSCIELPAASSNVGLDIDLASEGVDTGAYDTDGSGYTSILAAGGNWALGQTKTFLQGPLANEYLYMTTGATHTGDSVYTAGQFIIKLYGHPVLT